MVDRARVDQLLVLLGRYLRILRDLAATPARDFGRDPRTYGSAERFLQLAIETTLNIGHHLIAARGFEQPDTYAAVFAVLGEEGVLDGGFASDLAPMARMRNRLVHIYEDVDSAQVHEILQHRLGDFDRFAQEVTAYLDATQGSS